MSTTTSKPLKPKRGTTAQNNAYTGEAYEVTLDTDKKTLVVHDGLTAGGFPLARADEVAQKNSQQDEAISAKVASVNGLTPDSDGNVDVGGMPLGTVFPYTGKDVPAGTLRADGSTYTNMQNSFPEFYNWVVQSGLTKPLAEYTLVEGSCGFYGVDESTGTVRMPTLAAGVFGTVAAGQYGQAVQAGAPNIKGSWAGVYNGNGLSGAVRGSFSKGTSDPEAANVSGSNLKAVFDIDASRSSSVYRDDVDTIQPTHVKFPWVIVVYNAAISTSVAQAQEFIGLLDGKADKVQVDELGAQVDGKLEGVVRTVNGVVADAAGNVALGKGVYITETWSDNNREWYIKFSNGFIMQGGVCTLNSTWTTRTFNTPFATDIYVITAQALNALESGMYESPVSIAKRSRTNFDSGIYRGASTYKGSWFACGY
jgi:hypothetical protein